MGLTLIPGINVVHPLHMQGAAINQSVPPNQSKRRKAVDNYLCVSDLCAEKHARLIHRTSDSTQTQHKLFCILFFVVFAL